MLRTALVSVAVMAALVWARQTQGASVIAPTGASYIGVSGSSSFNGSYVPNNLFNYDVTGVSVGTGLDADSADWAVAGSVTNAYVAFQLGSGIYSVSSIYFAQRGWWGPGSGGEQMDLAKIWASQTTAFDPNSPPSGSPDATVALDWSNAVWTEQLLNNTITGRYFLVEFVQTNGSGYAPGGRELRLGGDLSAAVAPEIVENPANRTVCEGGTARFSAVASGSDPLSYQWKKGSTVLSDGPRISGATTPNLRISSALSTDVGSYSCTITNSAGSANSTAATLAVVAAPSDPMAGLIISSGPLAYYRLDESSAASAAVDTAGGLDGAYGGDSGLGVASLRPPTFPGFYSGNTALNTLAYTPSSTVTVPALNLNTNTVSLLAWIRPDGAQSQYASLVLWRGPVSCGLHYLDSRTLTYIWNNDRFYIDSGLVLPTNEWCMVGLVLTPTNATLYMGLNGSLRSSVDVHNQAPMAFNSTTQIGCDNLSDTTRVFNGLIDDVAIFDHPLTPGQVQAIYAAGVGVLPVVITQQPVSHTNYTGATAHFNVQATGTSVSYQWKKGSTPLSDGGNISGAHTEILAIANLSSADAGSYSCVVSNAIGSVPSDSAALTVIAAPTTGYERTVVAYKPVAYWNLDEAAASATVMDYCGSYDGACGAYAATGSGPQSPTFPGFGSANPALQTLLNTPDSAVGLPPLNLNANTVTVLAWIYPSGAQSYYTTMFMSRAGGTIAGLNYYDWSDQLGYQWNGGRWDWESGLHIPSDQWSFIGMVITPTNARLYLASDGGALASSTQAIAQDPEGFFGASSIGRDNPSDASRVFNGTIDSVAVFNRSLSTADVSAIYNAALGTPPPPATLNWSTSPSGLVLTWFGPWTLMQADSLSGAWTPATAVTSGVPIPTSAAKRFYRLQY